MHVLVINIYFAPNSYGGATVVAEQVAHALSRDFGHQVTALSATARQDLPPYATVTSEVDGIRSILINLPGGRTYADHYDNRQVTRIIADVARQTDPDIAHVHCVQEIGAGCIPALKSLGRPVVLSTHDYWWLCERQFMIHSNGEVCPQDPVRPTACAGCVDDLPRTVRRARALQRFGGLADVVTVPSNYSLDLHRRSGFAETSLEVWENGVHGPGPGFFKMQAVRRSRDPRLTFGFVGGPSAIKGWPNLRAAFSGLDQDGFRGLLVDGALVDPWWKPGDLRGLAGDWSVWPRYGPDDMDAFFAEIDVLLFLSQWQETFGLTVREALCRGVRVIQTDGGGTLDHGQSDAVRVVPLGSSRENVRATIRAELDSETRGCTPRAMRSFKEQARAWLNLATPLVANRDRPAGAA